MSRAQDAVDRFTEAEDELREFVDRHPEFFEELSMLIADRNTALSEAKAAVGKELTESNKKRHRVGLIGFSKREKITWDGDVFATRVPNNVSKLFLKSRVIWDVNGAEVDRLRRIGEIPEEVVKAARIVKESLYGDTGDPKPIELKVPRSE